MITRPIKIYFKKQKELPSLYVHNTWIIFLLMIIEKIIN